LGQRREDAVIDATKLENLCMWRKAKAELRALLTFFEAGCSSATPAASVGI